MLAYAVGPGRGGTIELGTRTSYTCQLGALAGAVRNGRAVTTDADWAVGNAELVDAAYRAAGLSTRAEALLTP